MIDRGSDAFPVRLGVLLSGRGSNFLAIHRAVERGDVPAVIGLVVSNMAEAPGLERARGLGVETVTIPHAGCRDRAEHEERVLAALKDAGVDWVCLAGYMRVLSTRFITAYPQRILNIHPSLLPAFPGLDAPAQAVAHGVKVAGCTVHLVDEGVDSGPIVVQRAVPVADEDTADTLAARILVEEHQAYPQALRRLLTECWELRGRRLVFGGAVGSENPRPRG